METININNDNKIFVVKKISNNIDGRGITIITININIAKGNANGFNFSEKKKFVPYVFVKLMAYPLKFLQIN